MRIHTPSLLIGLATASALALILHYCPSVHESRETIFKEKQVAPEPEKIELTFINPLAGAENFKRLYFDEMLDFRQEIVSYLDSLEHTNSNYHIGLYFKDLTNGASVSYNENAKFTPASLMKVPVLIALLKENDKKPGYLNQGVAYNPQRHTQFKNQDEYDKWGERTAYTLGELAEIMIHYSDNRATMMIIDKVGIKKVQKVQDDLHLNIPENTQTDMPVIGVKKYATVFKTLYNASYLSPEMSNFALELMSHTAHKQGMRRAIPLNIRVSQKFGVREHIDGDGKTVIVDQLHHFGIVYRPEKTYLLGIMVSGMNEELMEKVIYRISKRIDREIEERIEMIISAHIPADER